MLDFITAVFNRVIEILATIASYPLGVVGALFIVLAAWSIGGILLHFRREDRRIARRNRRRY